MKKLLSLLLVVAMLASLGLTAFAAPPPPPTAEADTYTGPVIEYPDKALWFDSTIYGGFVNPYFIMAGNGDNTFDIDAFINSKQGELIMSRVKYELALIGNHQYASQTMIDYWAEQGVIETAYESDDPTHEWITYVPEYMYDEANAGKTYPVVVALHGNGNDLFTSMNLGFVHICYENEFIVLTPEAENSDSAYMIANLENYLDEMEAKGYPIDRSRIYVAGMSKGGVATLETGLALSDTVAAIAPHSSIFGMLMEGTSIESMLQGAVHTMEGTVTQAQLDAASGMPIWLQIGESDMNQLPLAEGVITSLNAWLEMNDCPTKAVATDDNLIGVTADKVYTEELDGTTYTFAEYYNTEGVATVVLVGVEGLPHWVSYSYPELAWDFMKQYSIVDGERVYTEAAEDGEKVEVPGMTEMTVGGNTVYVYAPKSELVVSSTCTAPAFIVYGAEPYTAESAKAEADLSGLGALAAAEGATIVFVNPQGEVWSEADLGVYAALIDMYSNSSTNVYVDGIAEEINFMTGMAATKILGDTGRVYIYGVGSGADFVAANLMKKVIASVTYPDGFTMTFDRTPTSVTLIAPTTIPAATEAADIAVAVIDGPADAAEKLASLTDKVLISDEDIAAVYNKLSGAYRRQVGILLPMHDWAAEGISESVLTCTTSDGVSFNSVVYYADDLAVNDAANPVPLVLTFHGGGNTALYQAQASEWPLIGKANGFITVSVDNHTALTAAHIVELVEYLKTVYAIDESRIYASGFSMGSVKSWDLFDNPMFAGVAPMSGSFSAPTGAPSGYMMPVFYVGGEASPLPELCNQDNPNAAPGEPNVTSRIAYTLKANKVNDSFVYDADVNLYWGVNGDLVYQVTDKVAFKDSTLTVNLFASEDGRYYTALASSSNQSHEVYARNSWAAWDFLKQFSRNADGSITIEETTYTLSSDGGKVVDNSYNTVELPESEVTAYTVVKGDTLWGIASRLLGSGYKWTAIYDANSSIITDPNLIYVGQTLVIPGK